MPVSERIPESRRAARRKVDIACELISEHLDEPVQSRCSDLSPLGLWLDTNFPLFEGDDVVLTFRLPRLPDEVTLFATVRHVGDARTLSDGNGVGAGLEFENVSEEELGLLELALYGLPPRLPPRADLN